MTTHKEMTVILFVFVAGCASAPESNHYLYATFPEALSKCRQAQRASPRRRFTLPPTQPQVSKCQHTLNMNGAYLEVWSDMLGSWSCNRIRGRLVSETGFQPVQGAIARRSPEPGPYSGLSHRTREDYPRTRRKE